MASSEVIQNGHRHLLGSGTERILWWNTSLKSALKSEGFLDNNSADLVALILETTTTYVHRKQQEAVLSVVKAGLKHDVFMKALAAGILKQPTTKLSPQAAYSLLEWSTAVLGQINLDTAKKAAVKLVEYQAALLDVTAAHEHHLRAAQRVVGRLLSRKSALFADYLALAASSKATAALIHTVCSVGVQQSEHTAAMQDVLLPQFCDQLLCSKESVAPALVLAYGPLISSLSSEQLTSKVVPAALRALRRTPEPAMSVLSAALGFMTQNLSTAPTELLAVLVQQLRLKDALRPLAVSTIQALAGCVHNADTLNEMVQQLSNILQGGSGGKIKAASERAALVQALAALPHGAPVVEIDIPALTAAEFCAFYYKDETTEEVKLALLSCLAAWLQRCHQLPATATATPMLTAGLQDSKDSLRRGTLRCIVTVGMTRAHLRGAAMAPLIDPLTRIIQDGLQKATLRADGIAALLAAAIIAAADESAGQKLQASPVWSAATKADSALLSTATISKLQPADAVVAAGLMGALLLEHHVKLAAGTVESVSRALCLLMIHHAAEVQQAARNAARSLWSLEYNSLLMKVLLEALRYWMNHTSEARSVIQDPAVPAEDQSAATGSHSHVFSLAVSTLIPLDTWASGSTHSTSTQVETCTAEEVVALALAAHHPAITAGVRNQQHTWSAALAKCRAIRARITGSAAEVVDLLTGPSGLTSPVPEDATAAVFAIGSIMAVAADAAYDPLLLALRPLLQHSDHDGLSPDDITAYNTPDGLLSSDVVPQGVYVPQVVASKNVRKPRGRFKGDNRAFAGLSDDDDDDAGKSTVSTSTTATSSSSRPLGRQTSSAGRGAANGVSHTQPGGAGGGRGGGKAKDAASRQQEFRQKKLDEEKQVRDHVRSIKQRLTLGLRALQSLVDGNTTFAAQQLRELSPLVLPLLSSPLVGDAALATVRSLAHCMPRPLCDCSLLLGGCLRLVALAGSNQSGVSYADIPSRQAVAGVIGALTQSTVATKHPLPGPSYALVFPVLQAVLSCPHHTPLHDDALAVLALHVRPEQDIPRAASLELLYNLLSIIPAYRDRVQPLLHTLCTGVTDDELPAAASGLLTGSALVRGAALSALPHVPTLAEGMSPADEQVIMMMYVACHDVSESLALSAHQLWQASHCTLPDSYIQPLVQHLSSPHDEVRAATATAVASAMQLHPSTVSSAVAAIIELYYDYAPFAYRAGVAVGLQATGALLGQDDLKLALDFLIARGLADSDDDIRAAMVAAGAGMVDAHGDTHAAIMLPQLEGYLQPERAAAAAGDERHYDLVREGVVVLLGTLAAHLQQGDDKRRAIIDTLLDVLSTPSEAVQRAVSNCLAPLLSALAADQQYMNGLLQRLLIKLRTGATYGERRGAGFGIAGFVKGLGIGSLKSYGVMEALKTSIEDKKSSGAREGALLAFECLCEKLGRLFEPYVIHILPLLLQCFGDPVPQVRAAAEDASKAIMGQLSASGVKLVLPALLKGLEDSAWRTKQGSIQLLGAMAYCAPRQLGTCLPTIVPRLGGVLSDPHPKVQAAATEALKEVGSVIRNHEIQELVPSLLAAICDPNNATRPCLDTLLSTVFINTIDAPSLALIVPVVHRGLRDRSGDTKKRAARIVGSMCTLINDPKDMTPYVPLLMPELQKALVDPLPEVRATAARAMGSLMQGMGASTFSDLLPWLLAALRSEGSSVERSGAAQGLAEVLAVLGEAHLNELLPELLKSAKSRNAFVREGHLILFRYLPVTMEDTFQRYLGEVLPAILDGLSDDAEGVRDAALAAGRTFVDLYATRCLPLLLPAVEAGLGQDNWRIRQASVELCGELLFKVAGTSGKVKLDGDSDDEGVAIETYGAAILQALGAERRNEVLAKLYVTRSDVQYAVRNGALHVWKTLVVNTPKTLQQILPALMTEVIEALADAGEDHRTAGARCLGELVRKMGERVLDRIIPILKEHMSSDSTATRRGVCSGLREVLENMTRHQVMEHLAEMLPSVQTALCDADPAVREAAGAALGVLFRGGAGSAVDTVVPTLLTGLESPKQYDQSLEGLRVILNVRPQIFNGIVPKFLRQPVTRSSLMALGDLADVAVAVLPAHLPAILSVTLPLCSSSRSRGDDPRHEAAAACGLKVALASGEDGLALLCSELLKGFEDVHKAQGAAELTAAFCKASRLDIQEHVDELMTPLVLLLADDDEAVMMAAWRGLEALCATIPKDTQSHHVSALQEAVAAAKEKERRKRRGVALHVAGFCVPPRALAPVLPIYLQGVLQGSSPEVREAAAEGLGELVSVTSEEALKPFVVQITGPLIRIIGDRFPSPIKAAILKTLGLLIAKAGPGLKPFVPQLQTTFLKCLNDQASNVRSFAASNLGELTRLSQRVDQLATDLATTASSSADADISSAYLSALQGTLLVSGARISPPVLSKVQELLLGMLPSRLQPNGDSSAEGLRVAAANCLGALCSCCPEESLPTALASAGALTAAGATAAATAGGDEREMGAMVLAAVARYAAARLEGAGVLRQAVESAVKLSRDERVTIKVAAGRAICRLLLQYHNISPAFCSVMTTLLGPDQSSETQRQALLALQRLAKADVSAIQPQLPQLVPSVCALLQDDPSTAVKSAAEQLLKRALGLAPEATLDVAQATAREAGGTTKAFLTDAYLKRLQKLAEDDWVEAEEY